MNYCVSSCNFSYFFVSLFVPRNNRKPTILNEWNYVQIKLGFSNTYIAKNHKISSMFINYYFQETFMFKLHFLVITIPQPITAENYSYIFFKSFEASVRWDGSLVEFRPPRIFRLQACDWPVPIDTKVSLVDSNKSLGWWLGVFLSNLGLVPATRHLLSLPNSGNYPLPPSHRSFLRKLISKLFTKYFFTY